MLDQKIYTFIKVCELKSYTKAALALHLTQPAVTQHIRKLEAHYSVKLIETDKRNMKLTPEGKALYSYATLQMANEEQLIDQIKSAHPELKLGSTLSIASYYLPETLSNYLINHENLFSVDMNNTEIILDKLLKNEIHAAFVEGIFDKTLFDHHPFIKTEFITVANINHPMANKEIELKDLYGYPLIAREKGSGTRKILENHLDQNHDSLYSFKKLYEIGNFTLIKSMLKSTNAISFMYHGVAKKDLEDKSLVKLNIKKFILKDCYISSFQNILY